MTVPRNRQPARHLATVAALVAVLGACGGGSAGSADTVTSASEPATTARSAGPTATTSPSVSTPASNSGDVVRAVIFDQDAPADATAPTATLPDDLGPPDIVDQALAPMNIIGEPLPYFDGGVPTDDVGVGQPVPIVVGEDVDGEAYRIDAAQQGPTMIVIAAHWCPHCAVEMPILIDMADEGDLPDDLNVYAVLGSPNPQAPNWPPTEWLRGLGWQYPILLDGVADVEIDGQTELRGLIGPAMGTSGYPTVVLVDADGNLAARWGGEVSRDKMLEIIDSAL